MPSGRRRRFTWSSIAAGVAAVASLSVAGAGQPTLAPTIFSLPLHSRVVVSSLPTSPSASPPASAPSLKPFRTEDPEGLRQWKELLEQVPGALPRASGTIEDQAALAVPLPSILTVGTQFEGLANSDNGLLTGATVLPPDDGLGVGPSHVFQMVNLVGRVSDKFGAAVRSFTLNSFFGVDSGFSQSDPRVLFDAGSGRWLATSVEFSSTASSILLAVSTTSDPTGTFCVYHLGNPTTESVLQDFPMLGVSDDKVIVSYNGFSAGFFVGAGVYILNKADLLACASPVHSIRIAPTFVAFTPFPAQILGTAGPLSVVWHGPNALVVVTVVGVPGGAPLSITAKILGIRHWAAPPSAQQRGTVVRLNTGDSRFLSAVWQNNSLWLAGNEACTPAGDSMARSCLRVLEVATDTGTVRQDLTFGAAGAYYMYPAVSPDGSGNLLVAFTASSATSFAGVRATGRLATDPLNTLQASIQVRTGGGAQLHPSGRIGDYSGAAGDPTSPGIVWVAGEYIQSTGGANWGTFIAGLQLAP